MQFDAHNIKTVSGPGIIL